MKKGIILSVILLLVCVTHSFSQENVKPFTHLSTGIEFSTTGFGIEVGTSLHKNFALRGGFSTYLPLSTSVNFTIELDESVKTKINETIYDYPEVLRDLMIRHLPTRAEDLNTTVTTKAKLGLINGKILIDFYPSTKSSFHLTTGLYMGANYLIKIEASLPQETFDVMDVLDKHKATTGFDINGTYIVDGYTVKPKDLNNINISLKTNTVKPYFGLGFGRAIPKNKVGVQFDMGALFHGTPELSSNNSELQKFLNDELSKEVVGIMEKIKVYPVATLKISYKIF
jgi:hypothetical protein